MIRAHRLVTSQRDLGERAPRDVRGCRREAACRDTHGQVTFSATTGPTGDDQAPATASPARTPIDGERVQSAFEHPRHERAGGDGKRAWEVATTPSPAGSAGCRQCSGVANKAGWRMAEQVIRQANECAGGRVRRASPRVRNAMRARRARARDRDEQDRIERLET